MTYNPKILADLLETRALSYDALSERLGFDSKNLRTALSAASPRQSILNAVAAELAVPAFVFYMNTTPNFEDAIPDFRSAKPTVTAKSPETIKAIQVAAATQRAATDLHLPGMRLLPKFEASARDEIERFALLVRELLGISLEDQSNAKDIRVFYNVCRRKIEDYGIFVFHSSFPESDGSGFCLAHTEHPIIVVNTKRQSRGRRLFTLVHELAHVLLGQSGISDPFIQHNSIETRCNYFASRFLMPATYVQFLLRGFDFEENPSTENVAAAARRLKVSQQAAILRLEELRLVNRGSHDRWLKFFHNIGNPDYVTPRGGGGDKPPPQEKVKLAKYGFHFAKAFDSPLRQERISGIELYRLTGLKPKYQRLLFDYANSLNYAVLQDLELEDE